VLAARADYYEMEQWKEAAERYGWLDREMRNHLNLKARADLDFMPGNCAVMAEHDYDKVLKYFSKFKNEYRNTPTSTINHYPLLMIIPLAFLGSSMGAGEILLILVVVLLLFGAERLPAMARSLGKALEELRRAARDLTHDLMDSQHTPSSSEFPPSATKGPLASLRGDVAPSLPPPSKPPSDERKG
jgi:sec-independent protein translocase protein TatA